MSGKHTPGPWAVHPRFPTYVVPANHVDRPCGGASDDREDLVRYAQEITNTEFFGRHRANDELLSNARLIASAPLLLEELKAIVSDPHSMIPAGLASRARAAIAAAEGNSNG